MSAIRFSLMLMACSTLLLLSSGAPASAADAPRSYVASFENRGSSECRVLLVEQGP